MNWENANRKPVQRDGAYSQRENIRPRTRKDAVGKFSKFDGQWTVGIVDGHSIPENKIIPVQKADGSSQLVQLMTRQGSKQLQYCRIDFYTFNKISDWIGQRA